MESSSRRITATFYICLFLLLLFVACVQVHSRHPTAALIPYPRAYFIFSMGEVETKSRRRLRVADRLQERTTDLRPVSKNPLSNALVSKDTTVGTVELKKIRVFHVHIELASTEVLTLLIQTQTYRNSWTCTI